MARTIAYDLTRLFLGPCSQSPRGIDRVDIALADHFFASAASRHMGVLPTPWGMRIFSADLVRRGLDHLHEIWSETIDDCDDRRWRDLRDVMVSNKRRDYPFNGLRMKRLSLAQKATRMFAHLRRTGVCPGRGVIKNLPRGSVYLNIGQIGLAVPAFHGWLQHRPDVTAVFMLHDAIPLQYPTFVEPKSVAHHARMVRTTATHADAIITTTEHALRSVQAALERLNRWRMPALVRGLPLPDSFVEARRSHPDLAGLRYFVTCSTVEPRKNHALLINLWRRLVGKMGDGAPHLVIVGSRGWNAEAILALSASPLLRGRVHHVSGLSTPALARLILGASAVLCPSLAEGFGLTVLEGNALGVPTIASDIAAHREVAGPTTKLLPCDDEHAWERAILACDAAGSRRTPDIPPSARIDSWLPDDIAAFLERSAAHKFGRA
jgi:glycosyltransferase involved in cell wall biosynthesis